MGFSLREAMAVGAGFGWYSLAPGIIMDAGLIEASAVSFLHNVLREIISILFLPFVAEKIGCLHGRIAGDGCLPAGYQQRNQRQGGNLWLHNRRHYELFGSVFGSAGTEYLLKSNL